MPVIDEGKNTSNQNGNQAESNKAANSEPLKESINSDFQIRGDRSQLLAEVQRPYSSDVHQTYRVQPESENFAQHAELNSKLIFVNGMKMNQESIYHAAKHLANVYGKEVFVVPNDAEKNPAYDLVNCFACSIGPTTGLNAEKDAINNLVEIMYHDGVLLEEKINIVHGRKSYNLERI